MFSVAVAFCLGLYAWMPNAKKRRKTLAGQIRKLAETDTVGAMLLAQSGRHFSQTETVLKLYYWILDKHRSLEAGKDPTEKEFFGDEWTPEFEQLYRKRIPAIFSDQQAQLICLFLEAVKKREIQAIHEIADAVELLRDFKDDGDQYRAEILRLKILLEGKREQMSIRKLARLIRWPLHGRENGLWTLRRIAKELKFPIKRAQISED